MDTLSLLKKNDWWKHSLIREFPVMFKTLEVWNAWLELALQKQNYLWLNLIMTVIIRLYILMSIINKVIYSGFIKSRVL